MKLLLFELDDEYSNFLEIYKKFIKEFANLNHMIPLNLDKINSNLLDDMFTNNSTNNILFFPKNVFPIIFSNRLPSSFFEKSKINTIGDFKFINIQVTKKNIDKIFRIDSLNKMNLPSQSYSKYFDIVNLSNIKFKLLRNSKTFINIDKIPSKIFIRTLQKSMFSWIFLNTYKLNYIYKNNLSKYASYDGKNKYASKLLVESIGVNCPKTYQEVKKIGDLDFKNLPNKYIIKPSNLDNSRLVYMVSDGINILNGTKITFDFLKSEYRNFSFVLGRKELNPLIKKQMHPSIIVEEYIEDKGKKYPIELKIYVFNGLIKLIIIFDKNRHWKNFDLVDDEWNQIPYKDILSKDVWIDLEMEKPHYFEKLKEDVYKIYNHMNKNINTWISRFIRMDFFITEDNYYFSEFALFPNGGKGGNINHKALYNFGKYWFSDFNDNFEKYLS